MANIPHDGEYVLDGSYFVARKGAPLPEGAVMVPLTEEPTEEPTENPAEEITEERARKAAPENKAKQAAPETR